MVIEKLGLMHKQLLAPALKEAKAGLSEYTFANLYLFRENHDYDVITDGHVYIRGKTYDGRRYLMPAFDVRLAGVGELAEIMRLAEFLFPIPEEWLSFFPDGIFDKTFSDGDRDYVYTVEKMSTYRGRSLHKKRNLLAQFLKLYSHDALPLTGDRLDHARFILREWQDAANTRSSETDYKACLEALDRYEELILCGGIYYAEGEPAGFVLGEEVNDDTFVLHFAKARIKYKGIYQFMFNNFAGILPPKYRYINLEQDLDKENLRVFKASYAPDFLLRKARVSLK